jgi:general secretion pathway protein G
MTGNILLKKAGFSLFEMLIVVAIIGVLALATVPVAELTFVKAKETELEEALEEMRVAIAQYKVDCLSFLARNKIRLSSNNIPESEIFPRELIHLVNPEEISIQDRNGAEVIKYTPLPYLKKIPADPFVGSPYWGLHCASKGLNGQVATFPDQTISGTLVGTGVFDVSVATPSAMNLRKGFITAINGTDYRDW